jgi:calcium/proton exchanger cax
MAVASISAQSSIGMGAVINATFGSIIEIILYSIMLSEKKGHLVEGSIVGSLLAGVLLMPGLSMVSGALRRKEQKFNAKSAGVTSMMLIMAIIGTLTPTLFYQTYGNVRIPVFLRMIAELRAFSSSSSVMDAPVLLVLTTFLGDATIVTMNILTQWMTLFTSRP